MRFKYKCLKIYLGAGNASPATPNVVHEYVLMHVHALIIGRGLPFPGTPGRPILAL